MCRKKRIVNWIVQCVSICFFSIIFCRNSVDAWESMELFAYSKSNYGLETYARNNIASYIQASGELSNFDHAYIGKGISVFDNVDYEKELFPIWQDGRVVATLLAFDIGGVYTASFSRAYSEELNVFIGKTTPVEALRLVCVNEKLYAMLGDEVFPLNQSISSVLPENFLVNEIYEANDVINVLDFRTIDYRDLDRSPTGYILPFTVYYQQTGGYCYSYALGNILCNMGYSTYTPTDIQSYCNYSSSASKAKLSQYLATKGLACSYANSGYMSYNAIKSRTYNYGNYIYIGATNMTTGNTYHAFNLIGYSTVGGTDYIVVWNPWYTYTQTIPYATRVIPTQSTTSYLWDNGYLYNIH